jgi:signal transduction histidine kinase
MHEDAVDDRSPAGADDDGAGTVLLVEDNPPDARLIRELLRDVGGTGGPFADGVAVVHAESFEEARAAYDEDTRVVLLDLNLPDASGMDTVERGVEAFEGAAVVVLTGLDDDRAGRLAVERGAQDFLNKDEVNRRTLGRAVRYADERRRQERELERRAEKLGVLTWTLRHEIKDAMTVALGRSRSLREYVEPGGEAYLDEVVDATEEVLEVTDVAQEFVEALDDPESVLHEVDLRATVRAEVEAAARTYPEADVAVEGDLPEATVRGTDLLGSAFSNLLTNAVRHDPDDDPTVRVRGRVEGDAAVVEVADDGVGIPDERKPEVFELAERREGSPGSGVGLFLVRTVVDGCGGTVTVEDNDPRGSVFRVSLPLA